MNARSLIEFISAAVDSSRHIIDGPFKERGGIMLVAPPGSLKTAIIDAATDPYENVIPLSDLNVQQWIKLKDEFISKRYTALAFPEYEKIYQRHKATGQNVEGILKALTSEGYSVGPAGDPRMPRLKARGLVVGGVTIDCHDRNYNTWQKNGFLRRFLWCLFSVSNPDAITEAIRKWQRINFGRAYVVPLNGAIEMEVSEIRSLQIEHILKAQPGLGGTGYVLMKKIAAVLEWRYKDNPSRVDEILDDVAPSFSKDGGELVLNGDEF